MHRYIVLFFFAVLHWHNSIPVSDLYAHKYLSLPGILYHVYILAKNFTKSDILTVGFMSDNYKHYENTFHLGSKNCKNNLTFNFVCLYYSNNMQDEYIFIFDPKFFTTGKSWNESAKLCNYIGGYLPQFESKEKLSAFLALMKSQNIAGIEAIYIGLKTEGKVTWCYFFIPSCPVFYLFGFIFRVEEKFVRFSRRIQHM